MKRIYQSLMMVALILAASMSLTACSDDDENEGGGSSSSRDFLEVTIDGQKHTQNFTLPFVSMTLPSDVESGLWASSSVEEPFEGDINFSICLYHKRSRSGLLQSATSTYNVIGNKKSIWEQSDDVHNLTLQLGYRNGNGNCEVLSGNHKVTSIKSLGNDEVQVCGTFTATLYDNNDTYNASGKYKITVSVE